MYIVRISKVFRIALVYNLHSLRDDRGIDEKMDTLENNRLELQLHAVLRAPAFFRPFFGGPQWPE